MVEKLKAEKLNINLNYLAKTYGLNLLVAYVQIKDGDIILILEGEKDGGD